MENITLSKTFDKVSPITGNNLGPFPAMDREEVNVLAEQARKAQSVWGELAVKERLVHIKLMRKFLARNLDRFSRIIHEDNGKTLCDAITSEFILCLDIMKYYEKRASGFLKPQNRSLPVYLFGMKGTVFYEPVGVVGIIGPWNYPFQLVFIPIISALIAGNSVLVKHSSAAPMTGKILEETAEAGELPPHVFNVIWGKGISGQYLSEAPIDKLFFTGSTNIGKNLAKLAAEKLIPVSLELGGKDPLLVMDDADLVQAAKGAVWGSLFNSGQTCVSVERVYVTEKNYDDFVKLLEVEISKVKTGKKETDDMGAMTTEDQFNEVESQIADAVQKGARLISGGGQNKEPGGFFHDPVLLVDCTQEMKIIQEETFGPVVAVVKTKDEEQAVEYANDSKYGLSSTIFTRDRNKGYSTAKKIKAGCVGINAPLFPFTASSMPFGGIKESGMGRYHGREGLFCFCNAKSVVYNGFWKKRHFSWYPYRRIYRMYLKLARFWYG
ncbi:MAG: aldehyde dehydrogenase family protein [bacterium]